MNASFNQPVSSSTPRSSRSQGGLQSSQEGLDVLTDNDEPWGDSRLYNDERFQNQLAQIDFPSVLGPRAPASRSEFKVAILCALPLEADPVEALFDRRWDDNGDRYGKAPGDPNAYSTGVIGSHNVVLVYMPGMGKSHGAAVAAHCRSSFPGISLALVVGICGGAPDTAEGREIYLGDVVISNGLVQHDFGRQGIYGFVRKDTVLDNLGRPNLEIRSLMSKLQGRGARKRLRERLQEHLSVVAAEIYAESGHEGWAGAVTTDPAVHIGLVASGDQVMKSEEVRNKLINEEGVIAFEMEAAGVWDTFPCIVIKGVADYADRHKTKSMQRHAAATAAACAKAFLEFWS
jgi:nucleoside phosphorylase